MIFLPRVLINFLVYPLVITFDDEKTLVSELTS